jgi:hypothetical protein
MGEIRIGLDLRGYLDINTSKVGVPTAIQQILFPSDPGGIEGESLNFITYGYLSPTPENKRALRSRISPTPVYKA